MYPGFTDGDLERQLRRTEADLRRTEWMGQAEKADAAREERNRIVAEQKQRGTS